MKILLVSQMYPGPDDPDLGVFVQQLEHALAERGHELERAVLDRRAGGKRRYLSLARRTLRAARRFRPDVVYAHFLVPTGLVAALAGGSPLVVTAHGRDVRNVGAFPGIRAATRLVVRRAAAGGAGKDRGRELGSSPRTLPSTPAAGVAARLPLRRLAERAEERARARARVRPSR